MSHGVALKDGPKHWCYCLLKLLVIEINWSKKFYSKY